MEENRFNEIISELEQISELLYQENVQLAYQRLTIVLPKMDQLFCGIQDEDTRNTVADKLNITLGAMEDGDTTFLADTIQYELIEILRDL